MHYLSDRCQSQSVSALMQSFVVCYDTCPRAKQSNKLLLGLITPLHVSVRLWTDIYMCFLMLTSVFIKCSNIYPNIAMNNDHMVCIADPMTKGLNPVAHHEDTQRLGISKWEKVLPHTFCPLCVVNTIVITLFTLLVISIYYKLIVRGDAKVNTNTAWV